MDPLLPYSEVAVVDYETHYSDTYSLRSKHLSMTDYIRHPEFETQCASVWHTTWEKPITVPGWEVRDLLESIDWTNTAFCAHHCLPGDVEVLTPDGWLALKDAPATATIMQWDPATGALTWAHDAPKVTSTTEQFVEWNTNFHKCAYTPEHRMYFNTPNVGKWRARTAAEVATLSPNNTKIPVAGVYAPETSWRLSPEQAALMEAFRADGAYNGRRGMRFKLRKTRKVDRLVAMLTAANIPFTRKLDQAGVYHIRTHQHAFTDAFMALLGENKTYRMGWVLGLTHEARVAVLEEARHWDGCSRSKKSYTWACADSDTVEAMQLIAHTSGWSLSGEWRDNARGFTAHKPDSRLFTATIRRRAEIKLVEHGVTRDVPTTDVFCYTVPTGAFLIRSNGRVLVTGNCQFDGLITTHHYDIQPAFWLDTISMYRMLHGVDVPAGLAAAGPRYGFEGKAKAKALDDVKGKRLADMSPELLRLLMEYNEADTYQTMGIYRKMIRHIPVAELRIMDLTVSMYTEPMLELNEQRLQELHEREAGRRADAVVAAGTDTATLGSAQRFADHLRSLGVDPPMKISARTGKPTYAFAKSDLDFKDLLRHPNPLVVAAVEARLATKSALIENRSQRLLKRVGLPTPMYYNYWAARTGRWGGGDSVNWQNLSKRGDGAELRKSLEAPEGTGMIIADAAQIEARMAAWLTNHTSKIRAFANDDDTYALSASGVYGFPVNKYDHPDERFAGKVLDLSCQYGAGAAKVSTTFRLGNLGPPVDMSVAQARELVAKWRQANFPIVQGWRDLEDAARRAWIQGGDIYTYGPLEFELFKGDGYMHLPNGTYMKYPGIYVDENTGDLYYRSKNGAVKIWGGYLLENACQALSCVLLKEQMLQIIDTIGEIRICATTHDEILALVARERMEEHAETVKEIMSTTSPWCPGLPLNADVETNFFYSKV